MTKGFGIQQALVENNRRYSEANEALGIASRINPAIAGRTPAAPGALGAGAGPAAGTASRPARPAAATTLDAKTFLDQQGPAAGAAAPAALSTGGGTPAAAPAKPAVVGASDDATFLDVGEPTAGATDSYGGVIGALSSLLPSRQGITNAMNTLGNAVAGAPVAAARVMGGEKAAREVTADIDRLSTAIRKGGVVPSRDPSRVPPALLPSPVNTYSDAQVRAAEDEILLRLPYSVQAAGIRRKRAMSPEVPQSTAPYGAGAVPPVFGR